MLGAIQNYTDKSFALGVYYLDALARVINLLFAQV